MRRPADAVDVRPDVSGIMTRVLGMRMTDLLSGRDPGLERIVRDAIAADRDILIVGCAPADVGCSEATWRAQATVVLTGSNDRLRVSLRGTTGDAVRITDAALAEGGAR